MKNVFFILLVFFHSASLRAQTTEVLSTEGIQVNFEATGDEELIKKFRKEILPEVKQILSDLSSDLGGSSVGAAKVSFYSADTYHKKFPQTINTRIPAFYSSGEVHAKAENEVDQALKSTLRHELTHLLIDKNYKKVPGWLNEGLAMFEERKISVDPVPNHVDYNTLAVAKQDLKFQPLSALESQAIFGRSHGTVVAGLAYTTAYVAVCELKEKKGLDGIRTFLEGISKGKNLADEFSNVFGVSYSAFSDSLAEMAQKKS